MQETLSIKVTLAEKARLRSLAAARGVKISTILREGIQAVAEAAPSAATPSCYQLAAKYFEKPGQIGRSGRGDLSTNKQYLRSFGKSA
jgi:hypothetical protein